MKFGFTLSSEEFGPKKLAQLGQHAEQAGFEFLMISDHYHPWIDLQGQSPFVWNTIGALSETTKKVPIGTSVTGSIIRIHPAILAQAAATSQVQLQGRFMLGVGTGENLNEHVVGLGWPPIDTRREMLNEMIKILRLLWKGGYQSFEGDYYTVEDAKIYTMPSEEIPILYAAWGPNSAASAGEYGDGLITTAPKKEIVDIFHRGSSKKRSVYGQLSVVYEESKEKAQALLKKLWPLAGSPSSLNSELRLPSYFEDLAGIIDEDNLSSKYVLGKDTNGLIHQIKEYQQAGFSHVYFHNIGPHQEKFIDWFCKKVMPQIK